MTRPSDRIFGLVAVLVALAFIASALQIQTSFLTDPVGSKTFPILIGGIAALCGLVMVFRPDAEPEWPVVSRVGAILISLIVLIAYAYALKPLGFLIPTAIVSAILSYQIDPKPAKAVITGLGLSIGLYIMFRYALGLSLAGVPKGWF